MGDSDSEEKKPLKLPGRSGKKSDAEEAAPRPPMTGLWLVVLVMLMMFFFWTWRTAPTNRGARVDYMLFRKQLEKEKTNVKEVTFHGEVLTGKWNTPPGNMKGEEFNTVLPIRDDSELLKLLVDKGVTISAEPQGLSTGQTVMLWLLGPLMLIGFLYFMMRRNSDPMSSGMMGNFVRSPAKRFKPSDQQTTFADVAAMDHAKQELQEVVEFLKTPQKFQKLGAQIPKGVLLMGSPGTGKTLIARATAGEAGVPFYSINGSEFIQMFVGVGASRVRDLFRNAKENSPCILFIDEIDAVGRVRGAGLGGGHDEREQTLNQILSEMDGFQQSEAVIVIAATNRPDVLDPALLRPGRFDRHVTVDRPTKAGRESILKIHCRKVPLADDVNLGEIASGTIGFSGAELKNLVNEAALNAARAGQDVVHRNDFEAAHDKVIMGPRREEILSPHEREMTAYHEAGHTMLAWYQRDVDPVHKVTIIPRGRSLGVTQFRPTEDRLSVGEKRLYAQLALMLGGRAAEKIVFDEYTAGAEQDLKQATSIARRMVAHWGMSEIVGPVAFRSGEEHPFLGKEMAEHREHSEATAHLIDQEVQRILFEADRKAREILTANRAKLDEFSRKLVEKESLDQADIEAILGPPQPRSEAVPEVAEAIVAPPTGPRLE